MTTAAAWQRTIDRLDPEAFGNLAADEVLATARELLGEAWTPAEGGTYTLDHEDLRTLLAMTALGAFRKLIDAVTMEAITGDPEDDDPSWSALETTIESIGLACGMMDQGDPDGARKLLDRIRASWEAARDA